MNKLALLISLTFFFGLVSCKLKKPILQTEPNLATLNAGVLDSKKAGILSNILQLKNSPQAFSYLAEADYFDGKQSVTLNMDVSVKKNEYIYLNVKALGFVNVARVMVQPDSIRILDLINRKYISASYQFMKNFTQAKLGFYELQNMVYAQTFYEPNISNTILDSLGQQLILLLNVGSTQQKAFYNKDFLLQSVLLTEQAQQQQMQVDYANFKNIDGINYPHELVINISGEKKIECKFTISNFAGSIKKEPQFVIPKSYKVQVY